MWEKIKKSGYYHIFVIGVVVFSTLLVYFLWRGDYGIRHTDSSGVERLQNGLDRADDRISHVETELERVDTELDRATGTSREITQEVQQLRDGIEQN